MAFHTGVTLSGVTALSEYYPCPVCGTLCERYIGPRRQFPTQVIAGTLERHYCHQPAILLQIIECSTCECPVFRYEDVKYDAWCIGLPMQVWARHICRRTPQRIEPKPAQATLKLHQELPRDLQ